MSRKGWLFIFGIEDIFHQDFVPRGQTVDLKFYKDLLIRLRQMIRKIRPEKW